MLSNWQPSVPSGAANRFGNSVHGRITAQRRAQPRAAAVKACPLTPPGRPSPSQAADGGLAHLRGHTIMTVTMAAASTPASLGVHEISHQSADSSHPNTTGYQFRGEFSATEGCSPGTGGRLGPGGRDQRGFVEGIMVPDLGSGLGSR